MIPFQTGTWWGVLSTPGPTEDPTLRARVRRTAGLLALPPLALGTSASLALDSLLFPVEDVRVERPLFVVGPPRCGTTRLHRLLSLDAERFTTFRTWQILAPSVAVQRAVRGLVRVDARLGGRLRRSLDAGQARLFAPMDPMHLARLDLPEEDEFLLVHCFATELLAVAWPAPDALGVYRRFDALPEERRRALMVFYADCVRRHLLVEGVQRQFLSRSPLFCNKMGSLLETFPDAFFVVIVRDPAQAIPSMMGLVAAMRRRLGLDDPQDSALQVQFVLDCYTHALDALERLPPASHLLVRYEELLDSPGALVRGIYGRLGYTPSAALEARLAQADLEAQRNPGRPAYPALPAGVSAQVQGRVAAIQARLSRLGGSGPAGPRVRMG